MATRFCPNCGGEFVASADTCPDCDVDLVDERPEGVGDDDGGSRTGQVDYELHEWAVESRVMLQSLLNAADIPHVWEGTNLAVPAVVEADVDAMVAQVEATFGAELDPDLPKVAYDLDGWDDELTAALLAALAERSIPHQLDADGALVVHEADEDQVEAAFDELTPDDDEDDDEDDEPVDLDDEGDDGDDEDEDDEDGELVDLDAQDVMSDLFVAADRLKRKVTDHEGVLTLVERSRDVRRMRLPYGFDRQAWDGIVEATLALNRALDGEDEEIEEHAVALRTILRPYV